MKWMPVEDMLPVIPEGKHGVAVLVAEFDPGYGYSVSQCNYGSTRKRNGDLLEMFEGTGMEVDFMELYIGGGGVDGSEWGPTGDEVTHWMYLPAAPLY